jgi:two-component sensor histidine kinase
MVSLVGKKEESFSLAALVDEVRDLLRYKLERVEVVVSGDLQLYGDRVLLYSIFLTVFLNSLETFKLMRVENERIELEIRGSRLVYHDNSGAWPLSETDQNLGPYLVQTGLAEFGGKAQYLKDPNGTKIQMNFH